MHQFRRLGRDTGLLTDDELRFIDKEIIESVKPALRARELFEVEPLPNVGIRWLKNYAETDMSQAVISMDGEEFSMDRAVLAEAEVPVVVINKEFELNWRDLEAARYNNMPLDLQQARNASRQVAEEENKLAIVGEYTGNPAWGIEGLATATGRNTTAGGDWSANAITYVNSAIGELETDGFTQGPYVLVATPAWLRQIATQMTGTDITMLQFMLNNNIINGVVADPTLVAADGVADSALVVVPGKDNFVLKVAQDIVTWNYQLPNMNYLYRVYEVVGVKIKRPASICEITALT